MAIPRQLSNSVVYGPGGLSKNIVWPIITGYFSNPEEDWVIGWAPAGYRCRGVKRNEMYSNKIRNMSTGGILELCDRHAYSLKLTQEREGNVRSTS